LIDGIASLHKEKGPTCTWYLPDPTNADSQDEALQYGLYPDRIVFRSVIPAQEMQQAVSQFMAAVSKQAGISDAYLKVDLVWHTHAGTLADQLTAIHRLLDHAELRKLPLGRYTKHPLEPIFADNSKLFALLPKKRFETIEDIARYGAPQKSAKPLAKHHYYVAFLQADGDSIGQAITKLQTEDELQRFSRQLLNYAKKAAETVNRYGGYCFYSGGDDLLAAVPIHNGEQSMFELLDKLNEQFRQLMGEHVHLSFGACLVYKSHPMHEIIGEVGEQLFGQAKAGRKNALAVQLRKHSGSLAQVTLCRADQALYAVVEKRIRDCCAEQDLAVQAWLDSPIEGGDGNREFFVYATRSSAA
jgi:class 3 adenylate cyclase